MGINIEQWRRTIGARGWFGSGGSGGGGGDDDDTDTDTTSRTPLFYVSSFVCLLYTLMLASWAYVYYDLPSVISSICATSLSYIMALPSVVSSSLSYVMDHSIFLCKMLEKPTMSLQSMMPSCSRIR